MTVVDAQPMSALDAVMDIVAVARTVAAPFSDGMLPAVLNVLEQAAHRTMLPDGSVENEPLHVRVGTKRIPNHWCQSVAELGKLYSQRSAQIESFLPKTQGVWPSGVRIGTLHDASACAMLLHYVRPLAEFASAMSTTTTDETSDTSNDWLGNVWAQVNARPYTLVRWNELAAAVRHELEEIGANGLDAPKPQREATQEDETAGAEEAVGEPNRRSVKYLGVGLSGDRWRLFRNAYGRWDERGKFDVAGGNATKLLELFRAGHGLLTKSAAVAAFRRPGKSDKEILKGPVKSALNKLRSTIKANAARVFRCSEEDFDNPVKFDNSVGGWRIACELGEVSHDDDSNAKFDPWGTDASC